MGERGNALVIQGQITLILTPSFTALKCKPRIIPTTPCLLAVYATNPVHSFQPAIEETRIRSPPPFFLKNANPILAVMRGPFKFTSLWRVSLVGKNVNGGKGKWEDIHLSSTELRLYIFIRQEWVFGERNPGVGYYDVYLSPSLLRFLE